MYYDNKRTFYVKQYGPSIIVSVIAVALIAVGSVVFINKGSVSDNNTVALEPENEVIEVVENTTPEVIEPEVIPEEPEVLPEEPSEEVISEEALKTTEVIPYFENLEKLLISEEVNVISVDENGNVNLEYNGDKLTASMIGVNYTYATAETYNKIKTDLEGKKVKIAFDTQRDVNGTNVIYVYLDGKLYNATLLESGLATLKSERTNVALATDLSKAQAYARENKLGVWNK